MKTLICTVGLLLLLTVYCTAMPNAFNEIAPGSCCFEFYTGRMPQKQIISIVKTHSSCQEQGFVVTTAKRGEICVSQNLNWAQRAFNQQQVIRDE
ncbi:C-C motif chemokine 24-like [Plectropomus leopardus]|uniref:C-C motif chemokine 24-like n=1 Tax=Plectropomus leopardus TaxID=160734 RepID=UPI001C4B0A88|nr:C-C motif chemokine 24-like [Plectropomus leopardus]